MRFSCIKPSPGREVIGGLSLRATPAVPAGRQAELPVYRAVFGRPHWVETHMRVRVRRYLAGEGW